MKPPPTGYSNTLAAYQGKNDNGFHQATLGKAITGIWIASFRRAKAAVSVPGIRPCYAQERNMFLKVDESVTKGDN